MNIFVFDNTFEGLLTSVFEAYSRRVFPDVRGEKRCVSKFGRSENI